MTLDEFYAAITRCNEGIQRAVAHANSQKPNWGDMAVAFIHRYARSHRSFLGQEVIAASADWERLEVRDTRAWGRPFQLAQDMGYIAHGGYTTAGTRNRCAKPVWHSKVFEGSRSERP